jgi:hypothetical protein
MARPLSGKSAPKGKMSLIDRMSPGGVYVPPNPVPRQFESTLAPTAEPVETTPTASATVTTSSDPKPSKAEPKGDVFEEHSKKVEQERAQEKIDKDIKAYAARKAQKEAAARLKK